MNPLRPARPWPDALLVLAALAAARLPFLLQGPGVQFSLLGDDAFYYLEAARRAVESGHWPSMDGLHPTNGFHPLYMAILIALQRLVGTAPGHVIPIVVALNLALNGAAAWLVARHATRAPAPRAAVLAGVLLALNPGWTAHALAGVENSLSALLLLLVALRWRVRLAHAREPAPAPTGTLLLEGALCGLAMLARTDATIVVAALLAGGGWMRAQVAGRAAALRELAVTALAAALVVSPWLAVNLWRFGTVAQDSAAALAFRFERLGGHPGAPAWFRLTALSFAFWVFRFARAWGLAPLTGWLVGLSVPSDGWRRGDRPRFVAWLPVALCALAALLRANDLWSIESVPLAALEIGLGAVALLCGLASPRPAPAADRAWWWLIAGATALEAAVYSTLFQAFQVWYATGAVLVGVVLLTMPALDGLARARPRVAFALAALVALDAGLVTAHYLEHGVREGMSRTALADGAALRGRLEAATAAAGGRLGFGSFDSGKLSYAVHPFPVANLDGVMSHDATVALKQGDLAGFIKRDGLTHLLTSTTRAAEFQRVTPFAARPDTALTRRLAYPALALAP